MAKKRPPALRLVASNEKTVRHPGIVSPKAYANEAWPGANDLPWEDDPIARGLVGDGRRYTLEEVGAFLGLSIERVREIEVQALAKLRTALEGDSE